MTETGSVGNVEGAFLASANDKVGSRYDHGSRRIEVDVMGTESSVVRWGHPIKHRKVWTQFDNALAEIPGSVKGAVAGHHVNVADHVDGRTLAGLPKSAFMAAGRGVPLSHLGKRARIKSNQDSMITSLIAVRAESH